MKSVHRQTENHINENKTPRIEFSSASKVSLNNEISQGVTKNNNNNMKTVDKDYMPKDAKEYADTFYRDVRFPEGFSAWPVKEQIDWMSKRTKKCFPNVGESLYPYFLGLLKNGDCGRSPLDKPDWLDMEKFCRGQKFALDNFTGVVLHNLIVLMAVFCVQDTLVPLIISRQSHTPYLAFKRYVATICHMRNWYTDNPWEEGSKAYNSFQAVRKMHTKMRRKLCGMSIDQINEERKISEMYCPMYNMLVKDFQSNTQKINPISKYSLQHIFKRQFNSIKGLNQADMAFTQVAFVGFMLSCPEEFGIHNASKEDLEAFCYTWKVFGYILGIQDEYNMCSGTFEEIEQRLKDSMEYVTKPLLLEILPEWEHMSECYSMGIYYIAPFFTFDMLLLYLTKLLDVDMPNTYNSMTYSNWMLYNVYGFFVRHCTKVPFIARQLHKVINYAIDRAANYDSNQHMKLKALSESYAYSKMTYI